MNRKIIYPVSLISISVIVFLCWWYCFSITTIIFVRHADRDGDNDALTQAGTDRASELLHVAEKAGITAIYHSGANRTRLTVTPLSNALGVAMTEIADPQMTIDDIFSNHRGQTVIVAGHSNTVPQMIELAGGPAMPNISHNEYDNLFVLTHGYRWFVSTKLLNLQYGEESPMVMGAE
ncbi:MAG: histidine phosphatase family protein [Gammaproteobacteria bacterium]|nr:histidine phosphatase family protein [Gammaproteobacteria bacterium]